jgi:hypothetical protein
MALEIVYFTIPGGEGPATYIESQPPDESANSFRWIETFAETPPGQWTSMNAKMVRKHLWQHNQGPHRVLYAIRVGQMVVLHAFSKVPRKREQQEYLLAERRYESLFGHR